jgi:uncharacterized membrane protein YeaQ/YmgE (transglycosylase-associated protein family)
VLPGFFAHRNLPQGYLVGAGRGFLCEIWVGVVGGTMGEELFDFL